MFEKELAVITWEGVFPPGSSLPKTDFKETRKAVRVLLFDADGRIAVNHYPEKEYWDEEWYIPGGGIEEGEDVLFALKREVIEEVGCEMKDVEGLGYVRRYFPVEDRLGIDYCFVAHVFGEKKPPQLIPRDIDHKMENIWVFPDEVIPKLNLVSVLKPQAQKFKERMLVMRHNTAFLLNLAKNRSILK